MNQVTVVTTFHQKGYELYGKRCIESFLEHWPENYHLVVYSENVTISESHPRLTVIDLHLSCPILLKLKQQWSKNPVLTGIVNQQGQYSYKHDAVKFANKVFAFCHAATENLSTRYLVWLDSDNVSLKAVPKDLVEQLLAPEFFLAYIGRHGMTHCESGFLAFDCANNFAKEFFVTLRAMYTSGQLLTLEGWTDCHALDAVKAVLAAQGKIKTKNLCEGMPPSQHPLVNTVLGEYLDHLKGPVRKQQGHSFKEDYLNKK